MPYTTVDDVRGALNPGAVQDQATASDLSDDQLADAITEAQAEVDAKLGGHYAVPFADGSVPPLAALLVRDLAAYGATLTHRRFQPLDERHPVALRYAKATALLDAVEGGDAVIPGGAVATAGAAAVENVYDGTLFLPEDFDLGAGSDRSVRWLG